ncbi:MAG: NlpC/P60 family protein [bacterium]|nr:NlpC/P60 family protein [bacterium]
MKDKEFKARNKDADFSKKTAADTVLGRHNVKDSEKPFTSSEHKRYQQKFLDTEKPLDTSTVQIPSDSQEILKPTENNTEQQEDLENIHLDRQPDIPYSPPTSEPPKQGGFSNAVKTAARNKRYQRRFNQKTFDYDISEQNTEHSADSTAEKPQTDNAEPVKDNGNYDFTEQTQNSDEAFDRVNGNSDFQLGADSEKDSAACNPKQPDKNRAYQKKRIKTEKTAEYNIKEAVDADDTVFDRAEEKEDFVFETRESKTEFSFRPSEKKGADEKAAGSKNRLYQEKQSKTESAENADTVIPDKGDFQFKRAETAPMKADKLKNKAENAKNKLPHKRKIKKERVYDEQKKKAKTRLKFEKEIKPQSDIYHRSPVKNAAGIAGMTVLNKAHSKVGEHENENTGVEAAHKTEQKAESLLRFGNRKGRMIIQNRKNAPYKKAARLQFRAEKAEAKAFVQKTLADNPDFKKKSALRKFLQKKQIKKKYQQAKRAEQSAKQAKRAAKTTKDVTVYIVEFIKRHKKVFGVILAIALIIAWIATTISSCAVMGTTGFNSIMVSSYFAEDADIYAAENYYKDLESGLQSEINNIERDYGGYDEYNYDLAQIGHNPYELISYLTALYMDFTFNDVKQPLDDLFEQQYILTLTSQTETRTDDEGNEKEYKILNVTLVNKNITMLANTNFTDDQRELYGIYLESKGNRDYLFADDIYSNPAAPPSYTIPGEALNDATFRRLITEAEKYLGYPYVWGGSSPSTSFDCSGFVCWVYQASGVYPLSRTTAQGIFNQCAVVSRADAKPGDIIFFTGTYNAGEPVTHVGIFVGNGMMIHCGNPIQYASIDSSYWSSHFYAFGRLGGG